MNTTIKPAGLSPAHRVDRRAAANLAAQTVDDTVSYVIASTPLPAVEFS